MEGNRPHLQGQFLFHILLNYLDWNPRMDICFILFFIPGYREERYFTTFRKTYDSRKENPMGNVNGNKNIILTLEFVGIDDFSCPTYRDQFGHLWKDLNLGQSETPDLYSVAGNEPDGDPMSPIQYEYVFASKPYRSDKYKFEYMLLGRMRSDCEYYLGYGNRNSSRLCGNDPQQHIDRMKELWKVFPADKKPEWLTWEQLLNYEKIMCNH